MVPTSTYILTVTQASSLSLLQLSKDPSKGLVGMYVHTGNTYTRYRRNQISFCNEVTKAGGVSVVVLKSLLMDGRCSDGLTFFTSADTFRTVRFIGPHPSLLLKMEERESASLSASNAKPTQRSPPLLDGIPLLSHTISGFIPPPIQRPDSN